MDEKLKINDLDPKTDWVFKLIFTEDGERSKKALLSFLNAMLEEKYGHIQSADILDSELTKTTTQANTYHLDILIRTDNNLLVNLEMQNFPKKYFIKRSQVYIFEIMRRMIFFDSLNDASSEEANPEFAISLSVCNFKLKMREKKRIIPKNVFMEFIYIQMAQKTMVKVTQREREIARELAEFKYRLTIKYEREEERELAQKEIDMAKAELIQSKNEIVRNMKNEKCDIEFIAKITGLSMDEINSIN